MVIPTLMPSSSKMIGLASSRSAEKNVHPGLTDYDLTEILAYRRNLFGLEHCLLAIRPKETVVEVRNSQEYLGGLLPASFIQPSKVLLHLVRPRWLSSEFVEVRCHRLRKFTESEETVREQFSARSKRGLRAMCCPGLARIPLVHLPGPPTRCSTGGHRGRSKRVDRDVRCQLGQL